MYDLISYFYDNSRVIQQLHLQYENNIYKYKYEYKKIKVHNKPGPYRHCLQDLLDYVSSISLTVVAPFHNPKMKRHSANESKETQTKIFHAFNPCLIMNNSATRKVTRKGQR